MIVTKRINKGQNMLRVIKKNFTERLSGLSRLICAFWRKTTREGEVMPKFYYGLGYRDWASFSAYWFPIPFNYLIRLTKWISHKWNRFRSKPSWIDKEILKGIDKAVTDLSRHNITLELRLEAERKRADQYYKKYLEGVSQNSE